MAGGDQFTGICSTTHRANSLVLSRLSPTIFATIVPLRNSIANPCPFLYFDKYPSSPISKALTRQPTATCLSRNGRSHFAASSRLSTLYTETITSCGRDFGPLHIPVTMRLSRTIGGGTFSIVGIYLQSGSLVLRALSILSPVKARFARSSRLPKERQGEGQDRRIGRNSISAWACANNRNRFYL